MVGGQSNRVLLPRVSGDAKFASVFGRERTPSALVEKFHFELLLACRVVDGAYCDDFMDALANPESRARLGSALGKIASGLYIVTARVGGLLVGMLCSFVEQASFEPPMITLAIGEGRPISAALMPGGVFGLHVLGKGNNALMKSFARGSSPEAFAAHPMVENAHGVPQFPEASTFLIARVQQQYPAGDHMLHLAQVLEGRLQNQEDEPMVRVRGNGFKY